MHRALFANLEALGSGVRQRLQSVSIDGTSATTLLVDRINGRLLAAPKLYNEGQSEAAVAAVNVSVPVHVVLATDPDAGHHSGNLLAAPNL